MAAAAQSNFKVFQVEAPLLKTLGSSSCTKFLTLYAEYESKIALADGLIHKKSMFGCIEFQLRRTMVSVGQLVENATDEQVKEMIKNLHGDEDRVVDLSKVFKGLKFSSDKMDPIERVSGFIQEMRTKLEDAGALHYLENGKSRKLVFEEAVKMMKPIKVQLQMENWLKIQEVDPGMKDFFEKLRRLTEAMDLLGDYGEGENKSSGASTGVEVTKALGVEAGGKNASKVRSS